MFSFRRVIARVGQVFLARAALPGAAGLLLFLACGANPIAKPDVDMRRTGWESWQTSFWFILGVVALFVAIVVPLVLYDRFKYSRGAAQTKRDLAMLAAKYPYFEWLPLKKRVEQSVRKVYDLWSTVDLTSASKFLSPEFFAKQQAELKQWQKEGRQIVRRLSKLRRIEPIAVAVENDKSPSWVRVVVLLDRVDYHRDSYTLEVVHGTSTPQHNVEEVWVMAYNGKKWIVQDVEDNSNAVQWAAWPNQLDTTVLDYKATKSSSADVPATEPETSAE
jgi:hypothetical protein